MKHYSHSRKNQRGAALVVGLIMLSIITLLAITAMSTASTELIMAGNEQFRQRSFQASDAGLEQAARDLAKVKQDSVPVKVNNVQIGSQPDDTFSISSVYIGADGDIAGFSGGQFAGLQYRVDSTGNSLHNAKEVHTMGAYVLANGSNGSAGGGSGDSAPAIPGLAAP